MSVLLWMPSKDANPDKKLAIRWWKNRYDVAVPPRGYFFILHGMGEHSGRYDEMGKFFAQWGFDVLAPDFPGHGLSSLEGSMTEISGVQAWTETLDTLLNYWFYEGPRATANIRQVPYNVFGHSYGAVTVLNWAVQFRDKSRNLEAPHRVAATAAGFKLKIPVPIHKRMAAKLARPLFPYMKIPSGLDGSMVSGDPVIQHRYESDSLNHPYATPEMFLEMLEALEYIQKRARDLEMPVYLAVGENDPIADPEGMRQFYESLSTQKKFSLFRDSRHEIHNDIEKRVFFEELLQWMI